VARRKDSGGLIFGISQYFGNQSPLFGTLLFRGKNKVVHKEFPQGGEGNGLLSEVWETK
jgi:hypothetical protein